MKKVAFIIPGWGDSIRQKEYKQIAGFFRKKGIKSVLVNISWKRKVLTDYINQFMKIYEKNKAKEVYLLGFSWGAMIAFIASVKITPKKQILCSLSPYFKEDLKYLKKWWKNTTRKRRLRDFKKYSFNKLAKNVNYKTVLLAGSKEPIELFRRVNNAHKKLKNSELIIVPDTRHDISQREYLDSLKELISKL